LVFEIKSITMISTQVSAGIQSKEQAVGYVGENTFPCRKFYF